MHLFLNLSCMVPIWTKKKAKKKNQCSEENCQFQENPHGFFTILRYYDFPYGFLRILRFFEIFRFFDFLIFRFFDFTRFRFYEISRFRDFEISRFEILRIRDFEILQDFPRREKGQISERMFIHSGRVDEHFLAQTKTAKHSKSKEILQ